MANSSINLTSLDFDTLKSNFITYLSNQSQFKDYNFTGSNMNVLLDLMSYNTYLNSFYLNMVASEMFLDSAQKLDSVVSHAKELNYVPKSAKSSVANVAFTVTTANNSTTLTVPRGTTFSGQNSNGSFVFTTNSTQNYVSTNNYFSITNLNVYEGIFISDVFIMDYTQESQKFTLSNQNIDTDSLIVTVTESNVNTQFTSVDSLLGVSSNSNIYFLQAAQNGQYELVFGDGNFGRIPKNLAVITANYRVTNGTQADGISSFTLTQDLGGVASAITTTANSTSGALQENIESIRKLAPRYFATQQRAVASDDFSSLIFNKYGGNIADVSVFGGDQLTPKQYGKVAVCLKPRNATITPNYLKDQISNYLLNYVSLPTRVVITDPDYIYVTINSTVQYNATSTTKLATDVQTIVENNIYNFGQNNLGLFNTNFRYSKFTAAIDASDPSIASNETEILITKRITPTLYYPSSYVLDYNNPTEQEMRSTAYGYKAGGPFYDEPMITSSAFTYVDASGTLWTNARIRDDNFGVLVVYAVINNIFTVIDTIGSVDYTTGVLIITNLKVSDYNQYISIYMMPATKDIVVSKDKIILIDPNDVNVSVIPATK